MLQNYRAGKAEGMLRERGRGSSGYNLSSEAEWAQAGLVQTVKEWDDCFRGEGGFCFVLIFLIRWACMQALPCKVEGLREVE
jgi:hypothetical protein